MKHLLYLAAFFILFQSCKKTPGTEGPQGSSALYLNTTAGSVWHYHEINASEGTPMESDYTVTSTSRDTSVNGKSYHVYTYSYGGSKYLNKSGDDYYEYADFASLGQAIERLYLKGKASVNTTWSQDVNIPVPNFPVSIKVKINNQIMGISSRTVNGKTYNDVVHVKTTLTSSDIPAGKLITDINSYFAPQAGLIENTSKVSLDFTGYELNVDLKTTLQSADLK